MNLATDRIPKFTSVEILTIGKNVDIIKHHDCGVMITGDYLIVTLDSRDNDTSPMTSTGTIYHLSTVKQYKTYK